MKVKSNRIFLKILYSLIVLVVATILILSSLLYFNFEKIILNTIEDDSVKSLSQISYSSQIMIDTAKQILNQLYIDENASILLKYSNLDALQTSRAMSGAYRLFYTIPYNESIYFYNREAKAVYGTVQYNFENFPDQELLNIIDQYTEFEQLKPIPRQIDFIASNTTIITNIHNVFTFLFYGEPNIKSPPQNAVVINFSESWIRNIINSMNLDSTNDIFILDKNNTVVLSNAYYDMYTNLSAESYVQEIVSSEDNNGSLLTKINDNKYLIVYVKAGDIPWTFIQRTDYRTITKNIDRMRLITLLVVLSIIFIGLIVSYISSKRLYAPIGTILMRTNQLEDEKRKNYLTIKQDFLIKLLKLDQLHNSKLLSDKFNTSAISFDLQAPLLLIIFKIDHYQDFLSSHDSSDRELYKFAFMNVIQELFTEQFIKNDITDVGEDHLVLFLNYDESHTSSLHQQIKSIASKVQITIKKFFQISLSVTVSSFHKKNETISQIYKATEEISNMRVFNGYGSLLFHDDIRLKDPETYMYPADREKTLIECVLLGKVNEAEKIYHDIVDETVVFPFFIYEMVISRLSFAFKATIMDYPEIQIIGNPASLFYPLKELEMKSEIDNHFMKIISDINSIILLNDKKIKTQRQQEIIQRVIEFIENNYTDPNISIESIASELKMSSVYLGRVFKNSTSVSIADYILDLRMNYAIELLTTTDLSINEIAVKTGILNTNYFYTIFKKRHGMTPGEFKKIN